MGGGNLVLCWRPAIAGSTMRDPLINGMLHSWLDVDRVRRPLHRMCNALFGILVALGHGPLSSAF